MSIESLPASTVNNALELAEKGVPVFPCKPDKTPATRNGFKDATTDPQRVRTMFYSPNLLIGIPTGEASGLTVVDIDPRNGGDRSIGQLNISDTLTAETPSGGMHFYFKDARIGNSVSKLAPGVDVRGEGGYVIVPPSKGYKWLNDAEPVTYPEHLLPESGVRLQHQRFDTAAACRRRSGRSTGRYDF